MPNEEFIQWADKCRPEVGKLKELLDNPIPDELWTLRDHLAEIEVYNARMSSLLADAERLLIDAMRRELVALADGGGATSERKILLNFATKQERRTRDVIKGICRAMEYRLTLGMSLLKTLNTEYSASNAVNTMRSRSVRPLTPPSAMLHTSR